MTDDPQPTAGTNAISLGLMSSTESARRLRGLPQHLARARGSHPVNASVVLAHIQRRPSRASSFAHEVAHGVLGLRHLDSEAVEGDQASIMSTRPGGTIGLPSALTPLDLEAVRWVYDGRVRSWVHGRGATGDGQNSLSRQERPRRGRAGLALGSRFHFS